MKTRNKRLTRIGAALASIMLLLGGSAVFAPAASAGTFTQVCYSAMSPSSTVVPIKLQGVGGYISLYKGQCRTGVELVAQWQGSMHLTDYGRLNGRGEYRTPQTKTYIVTKYP